MTIELTDEDFDALILGLGIAAGTAQEQGCPVLFERLVKLADTVNRCNPRWRPYFVLPADNRKPS